MWGIDYLLVVMHRGFRRGELGAYQNFQVAPSAFLRCISSLGISGPSGCYCLGTVERVGIHNRMDKFCSFCPQPSLCSIASGGKVTKCTDTILLL